MGNVEEMVYAVLGNQSGTLNFENEDDKQKGIAILIDNDYFVWDNTDGGPYSIKFSAY